MTLKKMMMIMRTIMIKRIKIIIDRIKMMIKGTKIMMTLMMQTMRRRIVTVTTMLMIKQLETVVTGRSPVSTGAPLVEHSMEKCINHV